MNILLSSYVFHPRVGGIESVSMLLAHAFMERGHNLVVLTQTPGTEPDNFPFRVFRQPDQKMLLKLIHWSDVCFHNNITLTAVWPAILLRKPWVVTHQTWLTRTGGGTDWRDKLKQNVLKFATNISISTAVAKHVNAKTTAIIGNPYQDDVFKILPDVKRDKDLVFLGRLVSDKGCDLLLDALKILHKDNLKPTATFIGSGPEMQALKDQVFANGLMDQVTFAGRKQGDELVECLNQHRIMVAPSRWLEPFGIVALEGIATGNVVVGSEGGGLKDAIGDCGLTFPNGDAEALAGQLKVLLTDDEKMAACRRPAEKHLANFTREAIVDAYLDIFNKVIK